MKTARELLLERHRQTMPKLDAIRHDVLRRELGTRPAPRPECRPWLAVAWGELILPYRRIWAGLAAIWIAALVVNASLGDRPKAMARASSRPSSEEVLAFWRQEQLLVELIEPRPPRPAPPPKAALPRPQSQRRAESTAA